ncbi:MAG: Fe-S cluster assembly protein SufD [Anaerolineaceae bacterium]
MRTNLLDFLMNNGSDFPSELTGKQSLQVATKLLDFRKAAWQQALEAPFPGKKDEAWRRVNLDAALSTPLDILSAKKRPAQPNAGISSREAAGYAGSLFSSPTGSSQNLDPALEQAGVIFCDYADAEKNHAEFLANYVGKAVASADGKFAAAASALAEFGAVLQIPKGCRAEKPFLARLEAGNAGSAAFSHSIIRLEAGASVVLVLDFGSSPAEANDKQALHVGILEIQLEENADLTLVELQQFSTHTWNITHERAILENGARLHWVYGGLGASLSKNFIETSLIGTGAEAKMHGFYFASGAQVFDLDTQQNHLAPHTTSDLLYKGAVAGNARTVWEGMIFVSPEAMQTDGFQTNRNLVLTEGAEVNALPGLEILADDVRCSHGASVGRLDEDELFYLQTRGIPRKEAEQLVMEGFFGEIVEQVPVANLQSKLKKMLVARFTQAV